MSLSSATRSRTIKSLCIAEAIFAIMYFGARIYTHYRPLMAGQDVAILLWNLDVTLAFCLPGYVAAQVFRSHKVIIGISTGLLAGLTAILYNCLIFGLHAAMYGLGFLLWGAALGSLGGLISWCQEWIFRAKHPHQSDG